jgi:hypothetical protein
VLCFALTVALLPSTSHALPSPEGNSPNLLANPGFENRFISWGTCGTARLADTQAGGPTVAHSGRYAAQFGSPSGEDCPEPPEGYEYMCCNVQAIWQQVTIPANAPAVTVSFWYWVQEPEAGYVPDLAVYLGTNQFQFTQQFEGEVLGYLDPAHLPGWQLFRRVLTPDELAEVRGKTLLLSFLWNEEPTATTWMRLDDVRVALADERTAASPLPAALQGDGTRPIAYVHLDPENEYTRELWRMDTDGGNPILCYPGELSDVGEPTWANSGNALALIDGNLYPPDSANGTLASALTLIQIAGADCPQNVEQIYQTTSQPGDPPFIQEITEITWAPDDSGLAISIFAYTPPNYPDPGFGLARIELINVANGNNTKLLDYATSPHWSRATNRILFEAYDLQGDSRDESVWELDVSGQPIVERQLLKGQGFSEEDQEPTWAPDGQHFATTRPTASYRYDDEGDPYRNEAIMLFNRDDLDNPRQLLLADHGGIDHLAWSPDGNYLLYTLYTPQGNRSLRNVWWLNVATGATGPVTTDGLSLNANWRPPCTGLQRVTPGGCSVAPPNAIYLPLTRRD